MEEIPDAHSSLIILLSAFRTIILFVDQVMTTVKAFLPFYRKLIFGFYFHFFSILIIDGWYVKVF